MRNEFTVDSLFEMHIAEWRDRADYWRKTLSIPDSLLDSMVRDHYRIFLSVDIKQINKNDIQNTLASNTPRYMIPVQKMQDAIAKISKGFALPPETIAGFFDEDEYLGSDIRNVLLQENVPEHTYPDRIVQFSARQFMRATLPYLPELFWNKEDMGDMWEFDSLARMGSKSEHDSIQNTSHLQQMQAARYVASRMPDWVESLAPYPNLVVIAEAFQRRAELLSLDILVKAHEIQLEETPEPTPPPPPAFTM